MLKTISKTTAVFCFLFLVVQLSTLECYRDPCNLWCLRLGCISDLFCIIGCDSHTGYIVYIV